MWSTITKFLDTRLSDYMNAEFSSMFTWIVLKGTSGTSRSLSSKSILGRSSLGRGASSKFVGKGTGEERESWRKCADKHCAEECKFVRHHRRVLDVILVSCGSMLFWEVGRAWEEMNLDNSVENILLFLYRSVLQVIWKNHRTRTRTEEDSGVIIGKVWCWVGLERKWTSV